MEDIVLKWYCSKSKFRQVMAAKGTFKEVLGQVLNTTYELGIGNVITTDCQLYWDISLNRNPCDEAIRVYFRIVSNGNVQDHGHELFDPGQKAMYLAQYDSKNIVDYNLDLFFFFENKAGKSNHFEEKFQIENLIHVSTSLQDMFEKEHMTDIVFECESISLKAHKCVISIQSPVFEAMFTSPMLERELDTVVIKDMDPSVFHAMISFMYSGRVKVESETMACNLLYAAEKYQIEALKNGCIDYFKSILSSQNAIKILEISYLYEKQLKLHCLKYIKDQFDELKTTKDRIDLKFKKPALALEVYTYNESDEK